MVELLNRLRPQKVMNLEVRKIFNQEDIVVSLTRRKWTWIGNTLRKDSSDGVYFGRQKGKDNGDSLEQPGGDKLKKNSRPRPGVKSGMRHKIVPAGERL